jgi:hypothetical protein
MTPTVTVLAAGLNLLSFQGVTRFQGAIVVATVEGDLIRVSADGTLSPWVNVTRYGIPTGIVGSKEGVAVALSAQESGHFLLWVNAQGKMSVLADLSPLAGEFGAPFGVDIHAGYYPYFLVAISTDVVGSGGAIAQVSRSGLVNTLAVLPETPFGVGAGADYAIATQEHGQIVSIESTGAVRAIATLPAELGAPLDITRWQQDWVMTTTTGWLVALQPDNNLAPLINLTEAGMGLPTTLTTFNQSLIVATQSGTLLQVKFNAEDA